MRTRKAHAISRSKNFCPMPRTFVCTSSAGCRGVGPYGKARDLANSKPICGVRYMPRRWRTFAERKTPPFIVRTAGCRGGLGGNVQVPFLSPFLCGMTKKGHPKLSAQRATRQSRGGLYARPAAQMAYTPIIHQGTDTQSLYPPKNARLKPKNCKFLQNPSKKPLLSHQKICPCPLTSRSFCATMKNI
jgi:hypothetical protein